MIDSLKRLSPQMVTLLVLLGALATILAALGYQHYGGYAPCELCLQQRYAYYAGIPLAAISLGLFVMGRPKPAMIALALCGVGFLANAGLGAYHSGVEWKWWPGPEACAGGDLSNIGGNLLESLKTAKPVSCNDAPWRFLGLSFAGWNVLISLDLAAGAWLGVHNARHAG